ncbi:MAG TPA: LD-carboxypeptidase [Fimbriimonadaceae bacterium]|nr:LD-carboxypeptidase [Fimbriimonadaceae bacterium]HRJ95598.1 LD-carboxypeptidase [Fimbriimonadaceae bacterium]
MTKPRAIEPPAVIRVVSPASPIAEEKLQRGLQRLREAGYRIELAAHALDSDAYLAGSDTDRAADFEAAFLDPRVDAVYCSRGGYGCAKLLPYLDLDAIAATGKMFLGFSDITTLHLALNRRGLATLYAPMALSFSIERAPWVHESFFNALAGETRTPVAAPPGRTLVPGNAEGIVTGGCLCLLTDSIGTPDALDVTDRILLIEDVDEHPHRVDAMLTHLIQAGIIQKAVGIVIGEMTSTDEKTDASIGGKPWREIVAERLIPLGLPCVIDYPFGHAKNMLTMPLGIRARLDAEAGTLTYLEPCAVRGD